MVAKAWACADDHAWVVACAFVCVAAEARAMVEKELGAPIDALFSEFSAKPIAAASLAQVRQACIWQGMSGHVWHPKQ